MGFIRKITKGDTDLYVQVVQSRVCIAGSALADDVYTYYGFHTGLDVAKELLVGLQEAVTHLEEEQEQQEED